MQTLTYGRKKPASGDRGNQFWPALEDNIDLDDAHTHNGTDSAPIPSKNLTRSTVAVSASSWIADGTRFKKTVSVPSGYSLATCAPVFMLNSFGDRIYPDYVKIDNTSFTLYMPYDDKAVDVLFV